MSENIAKSSTKAFFGGLTGTIGVVVGLILVALCCCCSIFFIASNRNGTTNTNTPVSSPSGSQVTSVTQTKPDPITITYSGKGNKDTESFTLRSGSAKMTVKTTGGTYGTFSGIRLESEEDNSLFNGLTGENLNISTNGAEDGAGDTTIRGIKDGKYFISVISGVSWTVTITQE